jgi:hypothetical protein
MSDWVGGYGRVLIVRANGERVLCEDAREVYATRVGALHASQCDIEADQSTIRGRECWLEGENNVVAEASP